MTKPAITIEQMVEDIDKALIVGFELKPSVAILPRATSLAIRDLLQSMQWRTIDTCPSDVCVLLYTPHLHAANPERVEAQVYHNKRGGSRHAWATHWMPLPLPPRRETP